MRDHLLDIVRNTFDLSFISAVKVTGDLKSTQLDALSDDKTVVLRAVLHNPVAELQGLFGMPNLDKLKAILNLEVYREDAVITVIKEDRSGTGNPEPTGLHFVNAVGDFQNDYRFMTSAVVTEQLKTAKPKKSPTWVIEFEPTVSGLQRLKMQSQVHSDQKLFTVKTQKDLLKISFGDRSTHAGEFVFHAGITGSLQHSWSWNTKELTSILDLAGDKIMRISDEGAAEITVDSGLATYQYVLLAQTK